jgi:hypothetical protein
MPEVSSWRTERGLDFQPVRGWDALPCFKLDLAGCPHQPLLAAFNG